MSKRGLEGGFAPASKRFEDDLASYLVFIDSNLSAASKLLSLLAPHFPSLASEDLREVGAELVACTTGVTDVLGARFPATEAMAISEAAAELRALYRSVAVRKLQPADEPEDQDEDEEAAASDERQTVEEILRSAGISEELARQVHSCVFSESLTAAELENGLMELFDFAEPELVGRLLLAAAASTAAAGGSVAPVASAASLIPRIERAIPEFHSTATLRAEGVTHSSGLWEEIRIPAGVSAAVDAGSLIPISALPETVQFAFPGVSHLNAVQSAVFPFVFREGGGNVLISAPTGAGKTNIAVLALCAPGSGVFGPDSGLHPGICVYLAPMKALVREVAENLRQRFGTAAISELSGDSDTSAAEALGTGTGTGRGGRVIVATPEKWDVVSRKLGRERLAAKVKLLIIDEVHLLGEGERGAVLEFIIARHLDIATRIIGLSATIPNAGEIAQYLGDAACLVFGPEYRPVQLEQTFLGVKTEKIKSGVQRAEVFNQAVYSEAVEKVQGRFSVLVFVHSRRDTFLTAKALVDKALQAGTIGWLLVAGGTAAVGGNEASASREVVASEIRRGQQWLSEGNKELLPFGVGVHHAGLHGEERKLLESLFADGHVKVLVSTLTLAVGVNLPARKVVVKGTRAGGRYTVSALDLLQMLGRAGRPQYDRQGEGVVVTEKKTLGQVMALLNSQSEIESGMDGERLAEGANAEICRGAVQTQTQLEAWIKRLFFYRRSRARLPLPLDVASCAADTLRFLQEKGLIVQGRGAKWRGTDTGKIIANFYLRFPTYTVFDQSLRMETGEESKMVEIFVKAAEFDEIRTPRPEEAADLDRVVGNLPIPWVSGSGDGGAKISALLQSHIGRKIFPSPLFVDLPHVTGSATRLLRALAEMASRKGLAEATRVALALAKATEAQQWPVGQSALRQVPGALEIAKRVEKRGLSVEELLSLDPETLGNSIKAPKLGTAVHKLVRTLPRVRATLALQPLGRSLLGVEAEIAADGWLEGGNFCRRETFWVQVECGEGRRILFAEKISISAQETVVMKFTLPLFEPMHAVYYFRAISDRFFVEDCLVPLRLDQLALPPKLPKLRASETARALLDEVDLLAGGGISVSGDAEIAELVMERLAREEISDLAVVIPERWHAEAVGPAARVAALAAKAKASEWEFRTRLPKQRRELFARHRIFLCLGVDELDWRYEVFLGRARDAAVTLVCVSGNLFPNISDLAVWLGQEQAALSFGRTLSSGRAVEIETWTNFEASEISRELSSLEAASQEARLTVVASGRLARELQEMQRCTVHAVEEVGGNLACFFPGAVAVVEEGREFSREELNAVVIRTRDRDRTRDGIQGFANTLHVFCRPGRRAFLEKFFGEGVLVESSLDQHLTEALVGAVAGRAVKNKQEAVEFLSGSFLFQRLQTNPNFYGLQAERSGEATSAWLSEAVELGLETSEHAKELFAVAEDEFEVSTTALGRVAANHAISALTTARLAQEVPKTARKKQLIGAVARSEEMLEFAGDERRAGALLVAWLRRDAQARPELRAISVAVLETLVDVAVALGNLKVALFAVELRAAFEQAVEPGPLAALLQIPGFDAGRATKAKQLYGVEDVLEIGDLEETERAALFEGLSEAEIEKIAHFCNDEFPSLQLSASMVSESEISIEISDSPGHWWLFVAEQATQELVFYRKISELRNFRVPVRPAVPHAVYAMCGSFLGCDVEEVVSDSSNTSSI